MQVEVRHVQRVGGREGWEGVLQPSLLQRQRGRMRRDCTALPAHN